jgi:hypothetical protein
MESLIVMLLPPATFVHFQKVYPVVGVAVIVVATPDETVMLGDGEVVPPVVVLIVSVKAIVEDTSADNNISIIRIVILFLPYPDKQGAVKESLARGIIRKTT